MGKVVPNHTLETLRDLKNSLEFYKSRDSELHKEAIRIEKSMYKDVLRQTVDE